MFLYIECHAKGLAETSLHVAKQNWHMYSAEKHSLKTTDVMWAKIVTVNANNYSFNNDSIGNLNTVRFQLFHVRN